MADDSKRLFVTLSGQGGAPSEKERKDIHWLLHAYSDVTKYAFANGVMGQSAVSAAVSLICSMAHGAAQSSPGDVKYIIEGLRSAADRIESGEVEATIESLTATKQ